MKKRVLSVCLIICVLSTLLSTGVSAATISANTIAQEYKRVINSIAFFQYAQNDAVAFYDLNGDVIPEMFLWTEGKSNPSLTELQIWTYRDGQTVQIGSIQWGLASSSGFLYLNSAGKLIDYSVASGYETSWIGVETYTFDDNRNLSKSENVRFTLEYEISGYQVNRDRYTLSCTVNGQAVSNSEAQKRYAATGNDINTVIIGGSDRSKLSMTKNDALSYLNGIDGFFDVSPSQYYAESVKWAVENGITNGTGSYTFSPEATCTRAQILTFLWRAAGSPSISTANPFNDVKTSDYYYQAAVWAAANGMVSGNRFEGSTPCTRASTVTYIWQYAGSPAADVAPFSDVPKSSAYSQAVSWSVKSGITNGTGANQFSPDTICSRGQIVTFLYRARNINPGEQRADGARIYTVSGNSFAIELPYVVLLQEVQSAILNSSRSALSQNAQEYFICKEQDYGQGGIDLKETRFALVDLDGNGTQELLLSTSEHNLDALYTIQNSGVVFVRSFAYRDTASVYGDIVLNSGSVGASEGYTSLLRLKEGSSELYSIETFTIDYSGDVPSYYSSVRGTISSADYEATIREYTSKVEPTWYTVMDFDFQ